MSKLTPTTLGKITVSIYDGKHGDCEDQAGSGCYFISVKDLREYDIDYSNAREITLSDFRQNYTRTSLENGDTIYANTGDTIGKSLFVKDNPLVYKTSFQKSVAILKPNTDYVEPRYLYYLMKYETPRLRQASTGSGQKNLLLSTMRDFETSIHDRDTQKQIVSVLDCIDDKIRCNNRINDNLQQQLKLIYDYWFTQYDFPGTDGRPYRSSGGQMVSANNVSRMVPAGWKVESVFKNSLSSIIKPGVEPFATKTYLATAEVNGTAISTGASIEFETRESRANMQPTENSVWFAKMKKSIKHLYLNSAMKPLIEQSILSTGFCGLQCSEESFEYIASFIEHSYFETLKDTLAHGATQEAVNNDDLAGIALVVPSDDVLQLYHERTIGIYTQMSKNICENKELNRLRDWLLPMLMNGQVTVGD